MTLPKFTLDDIEYAMENYLGYCIDCGAEHGKCEPDTRKRKCEECGHNSVYGTEELLIMGLIE